ncbi:hypothetical protein BH11VER1_BH11VER1_15710 [soil metagenome]
MPKKRGSLSTNVCHPDNAVSVVINDTGQQRTVDLAGAAQESSDRLTGIFTKDQKERQLNADGIALRVFYAKLLALCQDPLIAAGSYWDLRYVNHDGGASSFMPFARYQPGQGRMLLVVANLHPNSDVQGLLKLPPALVTAAGLIAKPTVQVLLGDNVQASWTGDGIQLRIPNQHTAVIELT